MAPVQRRCENAHLIFGAVIDEAYSGRISVTLIASSRRAGETAPASTASPSPAHALSASDAVQTAAAANQFLDPLATPHPPSRCIAPPPEMSDEKKEQLYSHQTGQTRRKSARMQKELPLEIVFKGRFDKSEPTIRHGEDLDLPTYIRKGVALN
jgi:cell division protein FtsZ